MGIKNVSRDPQLSFRNGYIATTLRGVATTVTTLFKQLLRLEKSSTVQWPEVEYQYSPRFKGAHFLTRRPDGQVRCTACFLCATNCPAECITIVAGENPDNAIEKYPVRFEIDILRCVFCGFCEEACPVDAIRMGPEYTMAGPTEQKWIYTRDDLLERDAIKQKVGAAQLSKKPENAKHISVKTKLHDLAREAESISLDGSLH